MEPLPEPASCALQQLLGDLPLHEFRRLVLEARPYAHAGSLGPWSETCTWTSLDEVLRRDPAPDVLVVARGTLAEGTPPRSLSALARLFSRGIGIVVRQAERESHAIAALCTSLFQDFPGEQRVLVFATPAGTHGFGWHYDAEEVFILQTAGCKDYYFRRNTVDPCPTRGDQPDFSRIREETTPLMSCRLLAGDFLYMPRGFWHVAQPREDSLSVSIGIFPS